MLRRLVCAGVFAFVAVANANVLTNPGFEDQIQPANGNNFPSDPPGWSVDTGLDNAFNTVRDPGNGHGGSDQYLDLTNGGTYVYQAFSVPTLSTVDFGGYFSPRVATLAVARPKSTIRATPTSSIPPITTLLQAPIRLSCCPRRTRA